MFEAIDTAPAACGATTITPKYAFIVSDVSNCRGINMMLFQHALYTRDGQVRMGSGTAVGPERLASLVDELSGNALRRSNECFLPAQVIAHAEDMVAWHVPSARRPMFFAVDKGEDVTRDHFSLYVPWPSLLFVARGSRLYIAALATDARPDADTPVYHAPLMNQNAAGLCSGTVAMPQYAELDAIPTYEAAVFESNFSHIAGPADASDGHNHLRWRHLKSDEQLITEGEHVAFWRSVEKRRLKRFPNRHLLPMNVTVADFLTRGAK